MRKGTDKPLTYKSYVYNNLPVRKITDVKLNW